MSLEGEYEPGLGNEGLGTCSLFLESLATLEIPAWLRNCYEYGIFKQLIRDGLS